MREVHSAWKRLLLLFAVLALFVTACGGGGGETTAEEPADTGADATQPEEPTETGGATGTAAPTATESQAAGGGTLISEQFDFSGQSYTVGSKEFTEQLILGQIALQALQAAGAEVTDQTGLVGTDTVRAALVNEEIDMYWEYTGTGWVNILGNTTTDLPEDLYQAVADADLEQNSITWLEPAPLDNTYAIAATAQFAEEHSLETLSDMAAFIQENPEQGTLCAASEFINRDDGLPGLEEAYGFEFSDVVVLDLGLIYATLPQGADCNFGEVFATDGRILANDLYVLEDDQSFFIPYNVAMTMRQGVFEENQDLAGVFNPIAALLTNDVMIDLNASVDVEGGTAEEAARQFLTENGFIEG